MTPLTLLTPYSWCQNAWAKNSTGSAVKASDPQAVQWSVLGAIEKCFPVWSDWKRYCEACEEEVWMDSSKPRPHLEDISLTKWNDNATFHDVQALLLSLSVKDAINKL